jgi:hypothetical protein
MFYGWNQMNILNEYCQLSVQSFEKIKNIFKKNDFNN